MKRLFLFGLVVSLLSGLWNCQPRHSSQTTQNAPPVVSDILVNPVKPLVSDSVLFNAIVVDPDGDPISVNWKVSDGKMENDGRGNPIKFIPPNYSGIVSLSCIANDGRATGSLTKTVFIRMEPAVLVGVVSDSRSHSMIENAIVSLEDRTIQTESNGFFRFRDVSVAGPQLLSISKDGYKLYTEPLKLRPGMNTINVAMERIPGTVFGIVRDADSTTLLEGVRVALRNKEDSTSFSGYYEFRNIPAGTHTIVAKKSGFYTLRKVIEVQPGENQIDLEM